METKREPRENEAMISILINEQLDVAFLLKTISNIEYYMFGMIPHNNIKSVGEAYHKYIKTAFKSLALTDNQKIINADQRIKTIYDLLLKKYESEFVHECSACV